MTTETPRSRVMAVIEGVALEHKLRVSDIMGPRRYAPYVVARWRAFAAVKAHYPDWSINRIARFFGRDHTTVLNAFYRLADKERAG